MRSKRFPKYPDDTDYNTNSPSYYDDLARKQKLIQLLAEKIWEYEETLDLTLEEITNRLESYIEENDNLMTDRLDQWDLNLEKFPENVELLLQEWLSDGTLDHIINDTIFNWKADTTYVNEIEQSLKDIHVNVKDFGAMGDGIEDDTQAVKDAIAYATSLARKESTSSWNNHMPTVFFPAGEYVISEKKALTPQIPTLKGYNIKGAGYMNTCIMYTYEGTPEEEDDYLFYNGGSTWWAFSYVEDLSFRGTGNNNLWAITSQNGSPQANRFRRVNFEQFNEVVTVKYGSANANADLFRFESCKASFIHGWVFGVPGTNNSQSVVHTFRDCDFENVFGHVLYFRSGGTVEVRGGSWIINGHGRVIEINNRTGNGIGFGNNQFNFYGVKFEYIGSRFDEEDVHPLFYNNSMANISFNDCNFGQFSTDDERTDKHPFGKTTMGTVTFNNCYIPMIMGIEVLIDGAGTLGSAKPKIFIRNSTVVRQLSEIVDIVFTSAPTNVSNNPIVVSEGCVTLNGSPVDTVLNKHLMTSEYSPKKVSYIYRAGVSTIDGLPGSDTSFKLPLSAFITDVKIVFLRNPGNGITYDITVTNFDGSEVFAQGGQMASSNDKTYSSTGLGYLIDTEEKREIKINVDTPTSYNTKGFIMVEYY